MNQTKEGSYNGWGGFEHFVIANPRGGRGDLPVNLFENKRALSPPAREGFMGSGGAHKVTKG